MNRSPRHVLLLAVALMASVQLSAQEDNADKVAAKGATPVRAGTGYAFTEGPAVDSKGNVYFTDQPNDRIFKWSTNGKIETYLEGAGRSNGLYLDKAGNLWSCADANNELWKIDKDKQHTVMVANFEGKKFNGPNDLWIDPRGGVYFTDPFYKRDYWTRTEQEIERQDVYYLTPDGKTVSIAATDFMQPNGIVGSGDGKHLYVADIRGKKTYVFDILADGRLGERKLFTEMGSDGMTIDSEGNLYLTGKGVTVFDRQGRQIGHIAIDEPWTANVCFGGKDRKTLFITASKSVYTMKMKVKGAN
ncbi:MAG TPA: SMP-30/gluconolactonase/LRE family protein [Chryseolinea sp.]|nr:SMP-30/gluconolactonase/LRE family protein [Chryseolinea sp.]